MCANLHTDEYVKESCGNFGLRFHAYFHLLKNNLVRTNVSRKRVIDCRLRIISVTLNCSFFCAARKIVVNYESGLKRVLLSVSH